MKKIYETALGGDGAKVGAYIEGADLTVKATYPLGKVLEPVNKVIDEIIDKVEAWIPGDQKAIAEGMKADAHKRLIALLSEGAVEAAPAPAVEGAPV